MESTMKTVFRLLVPLLVTTLLAACGASTPTPAADGASALPAPSVIAEGRLAPARSESLAFPARGRISEILVKEGEAVTRGQVLVRLGDREPADAAVAAARLELTAARQAAEAQEAEARRTFQNGQDGPEKDQAALAEARLANAKAQHAVAQAARDRFDL